MADYTAPFHMPEFADKEFLEKKRGYVQDHGYSITIPKFRDIVHIGLHKPMSTQEKVLWYSGRKMEIGKSRQIELYYQKERSRERYQKMMASPIPNVISSITSVLTAIDDVQDAIISLAAIGRIACFFLPKIITSMLAWPIGLLWFIATIMGLLIAPSACALNPMACKRYIRQKLAMRSKTLKGKSRPLGKRVTAAAKYEAARLKAGVKGYATSGSFMPSFAEGIQMAQVTDSIFGIGISIGPIFGMAYDLVSGGVRWARGEQVSFKNSPSDVEVYRKASDKYNDYARWTRPKTKMSRPEFLSWKESKIASGTWGIKSKQHDAVHQAMKLHQHNYGIKRHTNWQEETLLYTNAEIASQGLQSILNHWDPVLNIEGAEHIEIEAYNEPNPLIEDMLREEGVDPEARIAWPSLGKRWATYEELQTSIAPIAAENINYFSENCPDVHLRAIAEMSATSTGLNAIASMIGPEWLDIQYHAAIDIAETLLNNSYALPLSVTQEQMSEFALWTQDHEDAGTRPNLKDILGYAANSLGFEFSTDYLSNIP
ncbi:hypothetical protein ES702_05657 [subsurface metagenome]